MKQHPDPEVKRRNFFPQKHLMGLEESDILAGQSLQQDQSDSIGE